jgi:hypothetical protein
LRDQLKNTQHQLKIVTARVDVALSKALQATDAKKFLLEEIENLGKAMKCGSFELLIYFCSMFAACHILLILADVCLDSEAEAQCVNMHLRVAQTLTNSIADNFWADRSKAMKLTILQDWIAQAGVLAETSHAAFTCVHEVMFPLNDQPDGLPALLDQFENGDAVYHFVREHLHCGALVALSFMRAHYPEVDLELLKMFPPTPSGRIDMDAVTPRLLLKAELLCICAIPWISR